jgi:uncharacterized membrane protein
MQAKNLNMKLGQTNQINKINSNCFFRLLMIDLFLLLLYWYYQPLCEPCLNKNDCPTCLSKEQYFIIYFGIALNLLFSIYCIFKSKMRKRLHSEDADMQ